MKFYKYEVMFVMVTFSAFLIVQAYAPGIQRRAVPSIKGPGLLVQAVAKGVAALPCDIVSPIKNDSAVLVIWYKNEMTPIYTYDVRGKESEIPAHWKDTEILEDRAFFRTITEPSTLSIDNVEERDEGEYRCRIDFRLNPTRNFKIRLVVITPPDPPRIYNTEGKEVTSVAGPYVEGGDMQLTCVVSGGRPFPSVRWWREEKLLTASDMVYDNRKQNILVVKRLERSDLHAKFTCQASNNNISQPVSTTVSIEIYFKPLSATILSSSQPLSADKRYEIVCQAVGSRPPAKITWWMDNKRLDSYVEQVTEEGNVTTSTLTFTPTMTDHDKSLICRANNDRVQAGVEEDTWKLDVYFIPIPTLKLGSSLNPDDIEEGDDVYFECAIKANPFAYKVIWKHNDQIVQHNQKAGVIMSNRDLALQAVRRQQAGTYRCVASNVEGDGVSNAVDLRVMYKPLCRPEQKRVYGVARHETATVLCEVEAYPPPDSFKWSFNNTAETFDVPEARYRNADSTLAQSTLTYTPVTEMDYGTVMCWASNTAGQQRDPCIFHIIAAGHPDSPFNCTLLNQTTESLQVECLEGFDGGQPQFFFLEAFDFQTGFLQANVSSKFPEFTVDGLAAGMILNLLIYAANSKGRSDPVLLEGFTLKVAEKQTGTPTPFELKPVIGYLIGVVAMLLIVVIIIVGALWVRSQHRGSPARPANLALKEKATLPLRSDVEDMYDMDDKNPDVIPCNKDSDYQLVTEAQTPAGLNNQTPPELPSYEELNKRSNVTRNGDLFENYKNRDRYPSEEVTYAELCLSRPTTLQDPGMTTLPVACKLGGGIGLRGREEPTIYAQIDHTRRPPPPPPPGSDLSYESTLSPLVSPVSHCSPMTPHPAMSHREIVTVRTPLMANQQESCV